MKLADTVNSFSLLCESPTNWAATNPGTTVTPGASNTFGSYVQIINGASAWPTDSGDGQLLEILVTGAAVSGSARDTLVTIGIDLAGGTSYTDWIVNLVCGPASSCTTGRFGVMWTFPVRVPRGSSLAAKASVNNATAGSVSVGIRIMGKATHPEQIRVGKYVRTFGASTGTSAGTAVTAGSSGTKGSWVSLGTVAAGDDLWFWQLGVGQNQATSNNNGAAFDLARGDGSNYNLIVRDVQVGTTTGEEMVRAAHVAPCQAKAGDGIYARATSGGAPLGGWSAAAYAVGG